MVPERNLLRTLHDRIRPSHTAVLVVDMQNDYLSAGGASDQRGMSVSYGASIVPITQSLLVAARSAGALVVYLQMTLDPDLGSLSDAEYLRRSLRWGDVPVVVEGTWGHDIVPELAPQPGDHVVHKNRASGFVGTNLDPLLRTNQVRSTIVTGVVTQGCVNATVLGAIEHDYEVTVALDCVAGPVGTLHDATLLLLRSTLGIDEAVVPARRIIDTWAEMLGGRA